MQLTLGQTFRGVLGAIVAIPFVHSCACSVDSGGNGNSVARFPMLQMVLHWPTKVDASSWPSGSTPELQLIVGEDGGYWAATYRWQQFGTLSEEQLFDMRARIQDAAAASLAEYTHWDFGPCDNSQNGDAYSIFMMRSDFTSSLLLCIVPEELSGRAKDHMDFFVDMFNELTSECCEPERAHDPTFPHKAGYRVHSVQSL